jgi:Flp pilus assembly protein TadG
MRHPDRRTAGFGPARHRNRARTRPGAAATELALVMPILCFVAFVTVDYARMNNFLTTITNCARNGALYASSTVTNPNSTSTPFTSLDQAVKADAYPASVANSLTYARVPTTGYLNDTNGNKYVEITVSCPFYTMFNYPGISGTVSLSRTVWMAVSPL